MFLLKPFNSEKKILSAIAILGATIVPATAQVTSVQAQAQYQATAPVAATTNANAQNDRLERDVLVRRGLTLGVGGAAANYGVKKVSVATRGAVSLGKVKNVTHWGPAAASVPVFGKMAAGGHLIPTTLGQVPVMGYAVKRVPLVGPIVAGPANPIVVGAVAIDNYVIPKYSPCGYTKSSIVAATNDFNSPPKLRGYVNYLAPMPYTHPPIYSPSTLNTDLPADLAYIDGVAPHTLVSGLTMPGSTTPDLTEITASDYSGAGTGGGTGPSAPTLADGSNELWAVSTR